MTIEEISDKAKNLDFSDERQLIEFIKTVDSNLYSGTDIDGNNISLGIQKGVGLRKSTYQSNGWIRINCYVIEKDDDGYEYILSSESYEK